MNPFRAVLYERAIGRERRSVEAARQRRICACISPLLVASSRFDETSEKLPRSIVVAVIRDSRELAAVTWPTNLRENDISFPTGQDNRAATKIARKMEMRPWDSFCYKILAYQLVSNECNKSDDKLMADCQHLFFFFIFYINYVVGFKTSFFFFFFSLLSSSLRSHAAALANYASLFLQTKKEERKPKSVSKRMTKEITKSFNDSKM